MQMPTDNLPHQLPFDSTGTASSYRVYGRLSVGFLILSVICIILTNLMVDPYDFHPWSSINTLERYHNGRGTRIGRGESLYHGNYQVIFAGTSRTHDAYAPDHPVFSNKPVYNAGLSKTTMKEVASVIEYAIHHNPEIDTILIGLDFSLFANRQLYADDYYQSRLCPDRPVLTHWFESILSPHVTRRSISALGDAIKGEPCRFLDDGRQAPPQTEDLPSPHSAFGSTLEHYVTSPGLYGSFKYMPEGLSDLRRILDLASSRGIQVRCVINCIHADLMECLYQNGLWAVWEDWKRDMVATIESVNTSYQHDDKSAIRLFDFSGFTSLNTESVLSQTRRGDMLEWFRDPSHCTAGLGNRILSIIYSDSIVASSDSFGVHLTSSNIEAHLQLIQEERAQWILDNPDEVAWVRGIVDAAIAELHDGS